MTHILSKERGFAFIHIPKNGGSTIRDQFSDYDDCGQKFFYNDRVHPELGKIAFGHLPLWVIAQDYPEEFAQIKTTWACAVTRDPVVRFRSALAQRARQYLGRPLEEMSPTDRQRETDVVMRHLEENERLPKAEFCHFTRQADYVYLDGTRIVKNVYPLEQIDRLVAGLGKRAGIDVAMTAQNRTEQTRFGSFGGLARGAWSLAKPMLPGSVTHLMRRKFRSVVVTSGTTTDTLGMMDDRLTGFIRDFYSEDFELHASALSANGPAFESTQQNAKIA